MGIERACVWLCMCETCGRLWFAQASGMPVLHTFVGFHVCARPDGARTGIRTTSVVVVVLSIFVVVVVSVVVVACLQLLQLP